MDFLLRPKTANTPLEKVPYVCRERYDGLDWMSYPSRIGIKGVLPPAKFDSFEQNLMIRANPIAQPAQFFQTWLFFGLISEFVGGNSRGSTLVSDDVALELNEVKAAEILSSLYDKLVREEDGKYYISTADFILILEQSRQRLSPTIEERYAQYKHLASCIQYAQRLYLNIPASVDPAIKYSIAAVGEFLAHIMDHTLQRIGITDTGCRGQWSEGYYGPEIRKSMMNRGWCPSDITRIVERFSYMQTFHLFQLIDRQKPPRDHSKCSEEHCEAGQIDLTNYRVTHNEDDCICKEVVVDNLAVLQSLNQENGFPLLRITGVKDNLNIEIVDYAPDLPYVAISHVWADGLGNPFENSLHSCQLEQLRDKASMVFHLDNNNATSGSILIWLDTLCCPVRPADAKELAILKIREVYQNAKYVLVLDKSLQEYEAQPMDISEQLARIFTSGWMRRLWTLQEGALAKSLYFQFADGPLSLDDLKQNLQQRGAIQMRYKILLFDIFREYLRLRSFFYGALQTPRLPVPNLATLDEALQHRSVSVPSDEPLCIATLMDLPLENVMAFDKDVMAIEDGMEQITTQMRDQKCQELLETRMKAVWSLLAIRNGGVPSQCVFSEEDRLTFPGWRWAPRSFSRSKKNLFIPTTRSVHWRNPHMGQPSSVGLQVQSPGLRLEVRKYGDKQSFNPWRGLPRVSEDAIIFRDGNGQWYHIIDKQLSFKFSAWTEDQREKWRSQHLYPLHDLLYSNSCAILLKQEIGGDTSDNIMITHCILGIAVPHSRTDSLSEVDGIILRTRVQGMVVALPDSRAMIYNTIERLAVQLRADPLTDALLAVSDTESDEHKIAQSNLKQKMKDVMRDTLANDPKLVETVKFHIPDTALEDMWVMIADWFNNDIEATRLGPEQVWYVD